MTDDTHDTLREQVAEIVACLISGEADWGVPKPDDTLPWEITDAVLSVFAERERVLQGRIEALHGLYDRSYRDECAHGALDRALGVFDALPR